MTVIEKLRDELHKRMTVPLWNPGGQVMCAEGHMMGSFDGAQPEADALIARLSDKHGEPGKVLCEGCGEYQDIADLGIWWRKAPKTPTTITVDVADLQALLDMVTP